MVLAAVIILARDSFVVWKADLSGVLKRAADFPLALVAGVFRVNDLEIENQNLRVENAILKSELEKQTGELSEGWLAGYQYKTAAVYATYPFNFRHFLTINKGSKDGLKLNMPVLVGQGVLLGKVTEVFPKYSLVRTIFDPEWEMAVRVGGTGVDALLRGGLTPVISLIDKKLSVKSGDSVYSSGTGFPYGLAIGEVGRLSYSDSDLFKRSDLALPYAVGNLKEILVIVNYNS